MADTQPPAPTDAELDELRQANSGKLNFVTFSEFRTIARAVLAKWGSQPVGAQPAPQQEAQEPVMIYHGDCTIDCGEHGHHHVELLRMIPAGSKLYTAPQPSPASQPVACEPLTDEQIRAIERMHVYAHTATLMDFARAIERAHGITGGQHGADT